MNVAKLRDIIKDLPDSMEVLIKFPDSMNDFEYTESRVNSVAIIESKEEQSFIVISFDSLFPDTPDNT